MKKIKMNAIAALSAIAVLGFSSCEKSDLKPQNPAGPSQVTDQTLRNKVYDAGIRSNLGYPNDYETNTGYYRIYYNMALGLQTPTLDYFGGNAASTVRGYGYAVNPTTGNIATAYAYVIDGYPILNYNGTESLITTDGSTVFTPVIEEIEIDPSSLEVYAIVKNGNLISLYRIDGSTGIVTLMTYGGTANFFYNPNGNQYKSGSICFAPYGGGYKLIFSNESVVYGLTNIVTWHYTISGSTISLIGASENRTYTGVTGTGKINTAWGDGKFYFQRDGGSDAYLFTPGATGPTGTVSVEVAGGIGQANDFAYWKNF